MSDPTELASAFVRVFAAGRSARLSPVEAVLLIHLAANPSPTGPHSPALACKIATETARSALYGLVDRGLVAKKQLPPCYKGPKTLFYPTRAGAETALAMIRV